VHGALCEKPLRPWAEEEPTQGAVRSRHRKTKRKKPSRGVDPDLRLSVPWPSWPYWGSPAVNKLGTAAAAGAFSAAILRCFGDPGREVPPQATDLAYSDAREQLRGGSMSAQQRKEGRGRQWSELTAPKGLLRHLDVCC